ncbi:type IV pili methyl-accepting chemotaxis transducer N-terminal domain-containing protein [Fibrella sp. HMF5405]|uniref:histidine kinase n=1 Tax=Fibrella forsythiae TaxID=2817061 RepID=A0ABS3JMH1_9BACT|nr:type IV pili methyl-accepting chemotaxis transducer N-terminal domain-containing protein [Fibrella forsythiae]
MLNEHPDFSPASRHSQEEPIRLTRLYTATLLGLALLLTIAEVITQWQIDKFQDELWLIRYTATQRHQSQQIAKKALQLADTRDSTTFRAIQSELGTLFSAIERSHLEGRQGLVRDSIGRRSTRMIENSPEVKQRYQNVKPHFEALQTSIRQLIALKEPEQIKSVSGQASLKLLLANENPFLEKIDLVVRQYTAELRQNLTRLQRVELWLHLLTLCTLIGIAYFIYRPAARRLRQTIDRLVDAEKRTTDVNRKLTSANKSLKKARQQLFDATKLQFQQQINEQKSRTAYLMAGQEEERKRLSRELHDGLGQMLTAIKLQVEGLEARLTNEGVTNSNLSALKTLITQTIQETRSISNNLMPSVLSDFGLIPGLRMLVESHNRAEHEGGSPLRITLQADEWLSDSAHRLDKTIEITLYRVSQEAVTNAIRHGKASKIDIQLFEKDQYLHLTITDNGAGFKTQRLVKEPHGQGVHNIHERIKLLNGIFKLTSTPGKGTKLKVSIPYHSQLISHDYDQTNAG